MAFLKSNFDGFDNDQMSWKLVMNVMKTCHEFNENLLRGGTLSLLSMVRTISFFRIKKFLKIPNETFLSITQYNYRRTDHNERFAKLFFLLCFWKSVVSLTLTNRSFFASRPCRFTMSIIRSKYFSIFNFYFCELKRAIIQESNFQTLTFLFERSLSASIVASGEDYLSPLVF